MEKVMTMSYDAMMQAKADAERRLRYEFQEEHPHYTPPRDAGVEHWQAWVAANLKLHGVVGFCSRFHHAAFIDFREPLDESIVGELRRFSYGERI